MSCYRQCTEFAHSYESHCDRIAIVTTLNTFYESISTHCCDQLLLLANNRHLKAFPSSQASLPFDHPITTHRRNGLTITGAVISVVIVAIVTRLGFLNHAVTTIGASQRLLLARLVANGDWHLMW